MTGTIVHALNLLSALFAIDVVRRLAVAGGVAGLGVPLAIVVGTAFAAAAASAFVPSLAALREAVFAIQPAHIVATVVGLVAAGASPLGRRHFAAPNLRPVFLLYGWRAVFGGLLLVLGLAGGLPSAFFWSAAIGDILVGVWALAIAARWDRVSRGETLVWNAAGLLDLIHVLALGATTLRVFYDASPDLVRLTLLPLFGVPTFIALHLLLFPVLTRRARPARDRAGVSDPTAS